jgi:carbamoyl-phosphate synthase small subunit
MHKYKDFCLVLENGKSFNGYSFGYEAPASGEVVFSTAMVGYPESLTDPSYAGQILTVSYPLVGNYGIPQDKIENNLSTLFESETIHVKGLIVSDYSSSYSHWNASKSLGDWLKEHKIPGIFGIDTRELTKILRENGAMKGKLVFSGTEDIDFYDPA